MSTDYTLASARARVCIGCSGAGRGGILPKDPAPARPGNLGPEACPPGAADVLTAAGTSIRARVWSIHPGPACPLPWGSAAMTRPVPALHP